MKFTISSSPSLGPSEIMAIITRENGETSYVVSDESVRPLLDRLLGRDMNELMGKPQGPSLRVRLPRNSEGALLAAADFLRDLGLTVEVE